MSSAFILRRPHGVVGRLLRHVALAGLAAAAAISSLVLYLEYRRDAAILAERLEQMESTGLPSVAENLWLEDYDRVDLVFAGMMQLPGIARLELRDAAGRLLRQTGELPASAIVRDFAITRDYNGQRLKLGDMRVVADADWLRQRAWGRSWGILATNLALIVVLCAVLYALTHRSVIRPLKLIAEYAESLGRQGPQAAPEHSLDLFRHGDEMWELMRTLNLMRQELALGHQQLAASEQRLHSLFSASPVSLWEEDFSAVAAALEKMRPHVQDFESWLRDHPADSLHLADLVRVLDVNDATLAMHHARSRDELLNRLPLIFTPDSLPAFQAQLRAIWNGETAVTAETTVRTLDGEIRAVLLRWKVAGGHETTLDRVIVSQEDITERKAAADQLAEALGKLRRSNAELERVTFVTAHDLLEPVRAVVSFSQLVERHVAASGTAVPELADDISYLQAAALRMKQQVEGLHRYATICQEQAVMGVLPLALPVDDALRRLHLPDGDTAVELGPLPEVIGNRRLLAELFVQLLENCLKFRRPEPLRIAITAERQPRGWRVSVSDNGIGIDPAFIGILFDLFRRLHGPDQYGGVGIGLPLCRKIMERHDGEISFDPDHYPGARVVLAFPAVPLATPPPEL